MPLPGGRPGRPAPPRVNVAFTVNHTSGDVLAECLRQLGWPAIPGKSSAADDLYFVMNQTDLDTVAPLLSGRPARVSRFPGMPDLCSKYGFSEMALLYDRVVPGAADCMPPTWLLPDEADEAENQLSATPKGNSPCLIVKPDTGAQGDGIYLCRSRGDFRRHAQRPGVAQRYVADPLLLRGLKFDFRLYVLLTSVAPLRAYLCRTGLARFCTEAYAPPAASNAHHMCAHLTNYAINKHSGQFVHTEEAPETASKRPVPMVLAQLEAAYPGRFSAAAFWRQAEAIVARTLLFLQLPLRREYDRRFGAPACRAHCFQLLGYDFLLDAQCTLQLLEVNNSPSLRLDEVLLISSGSAPEVVRRPPAASTRRSSDGPCRCLDMHMPHIHRQSPVDCFVKQRVVGGALQLLQEEMEGAKVLDGPWGPLDDLYTPVPFQEDQPLLPTLQALNERLWAAYGAAASPHRGTAAVTLQGVRRAVVQRSLLPTVTLDIALSNAKRRAGVAADDVSLAHFLRLATQLAASAAPRGPPEAATLAFLAALGEPLPQ